MIINPGLRWRIGGGQRRRLIAPGVLATPLTLTRAQVSTSSTTLGTDDATRSEVAADVPRYYGSARRLRIEGQRTNSIRNPRGDGLVPGTPGTAPTYWTMTIGSDLSLQMLALATVAGVSHVRARVSGTATASANFAWPLDAASATTVSSGQAWTSSASLGLTIASGSTPTVQLTNREFQSDGTTIVAADSSAPALSLSETPARFSRSTTMAASSARLAAALRMSVTNGQAYDFTMFIGWPTLELGSFASTPILPASGAPAASTRGADLLSAPLARLGIRDSGACTVLGTFMIPQEAPSGTNQTLFQLDDGTASNRVSVRNTAASSTLVGVNALSGSATTGSSAGTMVAGTPFAIGARISGGSASLSFNGGSVVTTAGAPSSGLTTLRIGSAAAQAFDLFGDVAYLDYLPYPVSDAQLQALVAAMPLT